MEACKHKCTDDITCAAFSYASKGNENSSCIMSKKAYFQNYKYHGCFIDDGGNSLKARDLNGNAFTFYNLTIEKCFTFCSTQGFRILGLQSG